MRHLLLSGCRSDQVSWDAKFPQGYHGAMTYHFARAVLEAWQNGRAITYRAAHKAAHDVVAEKFNQNPQLEGPDVLKDTPVFGYEP